MNNGAGAEAPPRSAGRAELDPTLNQVIYFIPSEFQRPRLVSQMILQDIQVLHVGEFSLAANEVQPTPDPSQGQAAPTSAAPAITEPDIITLIVSPQDAVSLTYLMYSGTKLSLVLRAPDDRSRAETEAATLQYILSQYNIPIPAKLPYGMEPPVRELPDLDLKVTVTPRP
jgi:pilus assembly protein CpaB